MHTAVNTSIATLVECLGEAVIGTHRFCETGNLAVYREAEVVGTKKEIQGLRSDARRAKASGAKLIAKLISTRTNTPRLVVLLNVIESLPFC